MPSRGSLPSLTTATTTTVALNYQKYAAMKVSNVPVSYGRRRSAV